MALLNLAAVWLPAFIGPGLGAGAVWILKKKSGITRRARTRKGVLCLLFFFLFAAGYLRGEQVRRRLDREAAWASGVKETVCVVQGTVAQAQYRSGGIQAVLEQALVRVGNVSFMLGRLGMFAEETAGLPVAGSRIQVRGEIQVCERASNPGIFDYGLYARSRGYSCQIYASTWDRVGTEVWPWEQTLQSLRVRWAGVLKEICSPRDQGIFRAVLLGDTAAMDPGLEEMYQRHGISHLLAVSGQHLTIVGGGVYLVLRRLGLGYKGCGAAAGVLVVSYGVLTGSSGSALRAVIMILCLWLARALGRTYDCLSALGFAALLLLWQYPYLLFQSGFQLSFAAVAAIGGASPWLCQRMGAERGWQKTLMMSLVLQMFTAPVVLWHYFRYPTYGLFLNLLLVPLAGGLMYSGFLGLFLGSFHRALGIWAVGLGHYILAFYELACGVCQSFPVFSLLVGRPAWDRLGLYTGALLLSVHGVSWLAGRMKEERKRFWTGLTGTALSFVLGLGLLFSGPPDKLRVTFLDVGQGDGIVLESPEGTVLADGGSTSSRDLGEGCLEPFLESRAVRRIDYAVVSHGDQDHISGLSYLLDQCDWLSVECLVLPWPAREREDEAYRSLVQKAQRRGTSVWYMRDGDCLELGKLRIECLYSGRGGSYNGERNAHSLVLRADYGNFSMLLTGDMDREGERELLNRQSHNPGLLSGIEVLKAAHHGSDTAGSQEFLETLAPDWAVISCGRDNPYGHPSPEVVERMENLGIEIWITARSGAVCLETDGDSLKIRGYLDQSFSEEKSRSEQGGNEDEIRF